jgi:hypothetical protein
VLQLALLMLVAEQAVYLKAFVKEQGPGQAEVQRAPQPSSSKSSAGATQEPVSSSKYSLDVAAAV